MNWKAIGKGALTIAVGILIGTLLETSWLWGTLIVVVGYGTYKIVRRREDLVNGMRHIETLIWGKPLDKDLWGKKELKHHKVKVVWKKKKNQT